MRSKKIKLKNYDLNFIKTNRYKTIILKIVFMKEYKEEDIVISEVLSGYMNKVSGSYPEEDLLIKKCSELYDTSVSVNKRAYGTKLFFEFNLSILDSTYIKEDLLDEAFKLLFDVIFNANIGKGTFNKDVFEREKQCIRMDVENYNKNINDYTYYRVRELIDPDGNFKNSIFNHVNDLDSIDENKLYNYYLNLIDNSYIEAFVLGNIEEPKLKYLFNKYIIIKNKNYIEKEYDKYINISNETKFIKENKSFKQSCIVLCYKIKDYSKNDYNKLDVLSRLLSSQTSNLLTEKLRYENNLIYSSQLSYNLHFGVVVIKALIRKSNYDSVLKNIQEVLEDVRKKQDIEDNLNRIKSKIKYNLIDENDYKWTVLNNLMLKEMKLDKSSLEVYNEIKKYSVEDTKEIFNRLVLDIVYLLEGDEDE